MSWEGIQHFICVNGHYAQEEDFSGGGYNLSSVEDWRCLICGEGAKHNVIIDWTNGDGEDPELIPVSAPVMCICKECGNKHVAKYAIFRPGKGWE